MTERFKLILNFMDIEIWASFSSLPQFRVQIYLN